MKQRSVSYRKRKNENIAWLFLLPSLLGISVFMLIPYIDIVKRSFYTNRITLDNYVNVIENKAFQLAAFNTLKFILVSIPLLVILSLIISYFITLVGSKNNLIKLGFLIPIAIPVSTVVLLWDFVFHDYGVLNKWLDYFGVDSVNWLNSKAVFGVLVFSYIWRNMGYAILLWVTGIATIPEEIIDASRVDGASKMKRFIYIICPNLTYYFFCIILLSLVNSFKIFREAYLIAGDYPNENIYLLQHLFNNWFRALEVGKLSAGAMLLLGGTVLLLFIVERILSRKGLKL